MTVAEFLSQHVVNYEFVKIQGLFGYELEPWQPALGIKLNGAQEVLDARIAALEASMTTFGAAGLLITVEVSA